MGIQTGCATYTYATQPKIWGIFPLLNPIALTMRVFNRFPLGSGNKVMDVLGYSSDGDFSVRVSAARLTNWSCYCNRATNKASRGFAGSDLI